MRDQLAAQFEADYGRTPARDELYSIGKYAWKLTQQPKPEGALDFARLLRDWEGTAREAQLGSLLDVGKAFWSGSGPRAAQTELSPEQARAVMAEGLATAQDAKAAWGKRDLIHWLAMALPDGFALPQSREAGADAADVFLSGLADRAIGGTTGEQVVCVSAPEYPRVPRTRCAASAMARASTRRTAQTCTRPRRRWAWRRASSRWRTRAMRRGSRRMSAPSFSAQTRRSLRRSCARLPRAQAQLPAQVCALTRPPRRSTRSLRRGGLRSSSRPRGAGKTYTAGVMAQTWQAAGLGRVFGLATSSAARNELAEAGVPNTYNLAKFLGHTKEQREALAKVPIGAGDLILVDEGTMASLADFDAVQCYAARQGAVIRMFAGDQQLGAVEGVGAAGVLSRSGQFARIREPVRFAPGWERDASLALHDGDVTSLQAYEEHGRLRGGAYEQMAEEAARMYVADLAEGVETSLNAHSHVEVADLNQRVQAYMDEYGLAAGRSLRLRGDATARPGEIVLARTNDNNAMADGERKVSNGDLLQIREITGGGVLVRRATGHDKATGQRTWSEPYQVSARYLRDHADLGYAQTTAITRR